MATNFIIQRAIEKGGIFPKEEVATLCRLAGWSESSGAWALYVKDVFEGHIDTSGLIYRYAFYFLTFPLLSTSIRSLKTQYHAI